MSNGSLPTTVTPMLSVRDAAQAIAFYQAAFGATERVRLTDGGKVSHSELALGGATVMVSDEYPPDVLAPDTIGGSPVMILLETSDVDALFARAVSAGATVVRPLGDTPDGSLRTAKINDPFGHRWMLVTRLR